MKTYAVKITWVEVAQPKNASMLGYDEVCVMMADGAACAIDEACAEHEIAYTESLDRHMPTGEIERWIVCGRVTNDEAYFPIEDGFETMEDACAWLAENYRNLGERTFYIDYDSHQNPAEVWAVVRDGELEFQQANGEMIECPKT